MFLRCLWARVATCNTLSCLFHLTFKYTYLHLDGIQRKRCFKTEKKLQKITYLVVAILIKTKETIPLPCFVCGYHILVIFAN